jgi:hypothetical protein
MPDPRFFEHFIITPYFVRFTEKTNDRDAKLRAEPDWLENRLELFKTFCLPSVVAQSDQNFRWHIYFDEDAPAEYLARVKALTDPYPIIEIKKCHLFNRELLETNVRASLKSETKWVLTTRLDNDDGWHRDFAKSLHAQVNFERREFLNFPVGLLYYTNKLYLYRHASNAFISFLEPSDSFLTVWCGPHPYLSKVAPVRQLLPFPAFVQVIHGQTRSNKPRGVRIHRMLAVEGFEAIQAFTADPISETDLEIVLGNLTSVAWWAARDRAVSFARVVARKIVGTGIGGARVANLLRRLTVDY